MLAPVLQVDPYQEAHLDLAGVVVHLVPVAVVDHPSLVEVVVHLVPVEVVVRLDREDQEVGVVQKELVHVELVDLEEVVHLVVVGHLRILEMVANFEIHKYF